MTAALPEPKFEVVTIGPCQYRKLVLGDSGPLVRGKHQEYEEEDDRPEIPLDYEGDQYVHKMEVMSVYIKFLIGKGGRTKQKLEQDSGASIYIPAKEAKDQRLVIKSKSKYDIYSARAQIELLLEKEEEKLDFTHYFALPLTIDSFPKFKDEVLAQNYPTFGPMLFQRPDKLHFTLCMLRIHTDEQMQKAFTIMADWEQRLQKDALVAHCVGLHYMNDDPKAVDVVFTTDVSPELLRKMNTLLDQLYGTLIHNGLISQKSLHKQRLLSTQDTAEIKLHATLLNSKWWPDGGTMDVRDCVQKFQNFDFGHIPLKTVNLIELRTSQVVPRP